ncbi:zinc-dependent alcohol dehydrogenase family protein [Halomonas saccharevitans]|uniref:alcohol dehydrogenase n=1 Tax=Halomonas saccharevitans TaxID=416872 RepID=A0A1I7ALW5_9GAMM|nr:zinc-dependent alcohol dehydrogenase family protein [Halomonas saccharevitans]MDT8880788.1 zinc-dependent alcohol dehydrogenase family protein [Halomonas saccharevitans]SFT75928.1 alcohol dehydrogenase, propanol-preferring [Halomonas saccharevitans]
MSEMRAMRLHAAGQPLRLERLPLPEPGPGEVRVRVLACGVCRTDLHVLDGELAEPRLPLIPGHEIVGEVAARGEGVTDLAIGQRVGVPWLGWTCGECDPCRAGRENLCERAEFTGYTRDGGYAEYCVADARYCFPLPAEDAQAAAPLLCAGLIGYRTWRLAGGETNRRLGLYGFGAAAHILAQLAVARGQSVYAFTRPGDTQAQAFARRLGAVWAGGSDEAPPEPLDAALLFAPVGALIPTALAAVRPGGTVVSGGIHMSDIPAFPYRLLWEERSLKSVANLTRRDGEEFLALAPEVPIRTETRAYPLEEANQALEDLREGRLSGAAVLIP